MVRGRGYSSPRGSSYRGSRGNSWGGNRGGYGGNSGGRFSSSFSNSYDRGMDKGRYGSDRFSRGDDYHKSYRQDSYSSRDGGHRSPDRKRPRTDGPSSRHDSYNSYSRYHDYPEKRGYSGDRDRHSLATSTPYPSRRDEFRKPSVPRGSYRGRVSNRGSRGIRRDRGAPPRRRLMDSSYGIRKRGLTMRSSEFTRRKNVLRIRSTLTRRKRIDSDKAASSDEEEKEDKEKDKKEDEKDTENKEGEEDKEGEEKKEVKEKEGEPKEKKEEEEENDDKGEKKRNFIKLVCPQCTIRVPTFRRYEMHLQGRSHLIAMRKVAMKQKSILGQMRQAQRNAQNELEKKGSSEDLTSHTQFCPLCKLNYKQHKSVHQKSEAHKNMKKFLMPFCKVCSITFKSPMIFESHLCSIEHIKRKQRCENASDGSGEEDNLEDFTTIDSVGDVEEPAAGSEEEKKEEKKKEKVDVGIELIKKIEAYYCDLCRMYLPRAQEEEMPDVLSRHCKKRFHMQRYIRHKENEELEKRAEKLQRKELAEKEKKKVETKKDGEQDTSESKEAEPKDEEMKEADTNKSTEDDKLWEAVDKDLGELLGEAGHKSDDDDDDDSHVNGERYDRFKLSDEKEKNGEDKKDDVEEEEKPVEENVEDKKEEESK